MQLKVEKMEKVSKVAAGRHAVSTSDEDKNERKLQVGTCKTRCR